MTPTPSDRKLKLQLEQQIQRKRRARDESDSLLASTVYLGSIGLMFILPVVLLTYFGLWLDERGQGYSVHWTIGMLLLGIVVGGLNVYFFIRERS